MILRDNIDLKRFANNPDHSDLENAAKRSNVASVSPYLIPQVQGETPDCHTKGGTIAMY